MKSKFNFQRGFTLVEVLTVMLVLVAIASITVESTKDFVFQGRYDITKDRYEKIKKAIIGDPNQVINGQPNIEGFVKDVGRLPFALQELTDGYCSANADTTTHFYATSTACTDPIVGGQWITKAYLSSSDALKDGWGNLFIFIRPSTDTSILYSQGKDGTDGNGTSEYDKDYPITGSSNIAIKSTDWQINLNQIQIAINTSHGGICNTETCSKPAYITKTDCETNLGTWAIQTAKANCEAGGKSWVYNTPTNLTNLCIKIIRNASSSKAYDSDKNFYNDGQIHTIPFSTSVNVAMGDFIGLVLQGACSNQITSPTYSSSNQNSICVNTADDVAFTPTNCTTKNGIWIYDGYEHYCNNVLPSDCSGTLKGTMYPKFHINLIPNTTLPTINW